MSNFLYEWRFNKWMMKKEYYTTRNGDWEQELWSNIFFPISRMSLCIFNTDGHIALYKIVYNDNKKGFLIRNNETDQIFLIDIVVEIIIRLIKTFELGVLMVLIIKKGRKIKDILFSKKGHGKRVPIQLSLVFRSYIRSG